MRSPKCFGPACPVSIPLDGKQIHLRKDVGNGTPTLRRADERVQEARAQFILCRRRLVVEIRQKREELVRRGVGGDSDDRRESRMIAWSSEDTWQCAVQCYMARLDLVRERLADPARDLEAYRARLEGPSSAQAMRSIRKH